jgi:hypothetical protein
MDNNELAAQGRRLAESGRYSPPPAAAVANNGNMSLLDDEPPDVDDHHAGEYNTIELADADDDGGTTTWEPVDLGPYLRGEVKRPEATMGLVRSDGQRHIYPGREHSVVGETESGKTWFADACVAVELLSGNYVSYIHYEEGDPESTIERLRLLGVPAALIDGRLRFAGPSRPLRSSEWLEPLLDPAPSLVVHDGVNEAMALHGADIMAAEGAANFRRRLIMPFLRVGAATLSCDHMPMVRDGSRRDAYGSVHKGNALNGARIVLENVEPFGRKLRGVSHVYVTKDRPGHLRAHGRPTKTPGKTYMGTFVVDDSQMYGPDFAVKFFAPKDDDDAEAGDPAAELANTVYDVIAALPDSTVSSMQLLFAEMRKAGHPARQCDVRDAVADLTVAGRVIEISGKRGAKGFGAVLTSSQSITSSDPVPDPVPDLVPFKEGTGDEVTGTDLVPVGGRGGTRSDEVKEKGIEGMAE